MILIVDSDPDFLEKARQMLNRERQVFLASSSRQALNLAKDVGFSVVLVGLELNDGAELIQEIRKNFPGLPVIAIAGEKARVAKELGEVQVLRKPATPEWKPVVERARALRARG